MTTYATATPTTGDTFNGKPVPKLCPRCFKALGQTDWCPVCRGNVAAAERDGVQEARDRIRAAMRLAASLNVTLNAHACDDDFGQPNAASAIVDELTLALDALMRARIDAEVAASGLEPVTDEQIAATVAAVKARVAR